MDDWTDPNFVADAVAAQVEDLDTAEAVTVLREVADDIARRLDEPIPYTLTAKGAGAWSE